jgi:hypothetical protein
MAGVQRAPADRGEESLVILQSLLCMLREKNILTRSDIEELCQKVSLRASGAADGPLSCCPESALAASEDMQRLTSYMGRRYGGKHAKGI